ncbi:MAG: carboxypeptidase-like regulatory domain-containing protein [Gemmatimonas sp.]
MKHLHFFLLCVFQLLTPQIASAQDQIFRGRVVAASTQAPLVGALVQVRKPNGEIVTTTTTSASGNYATAGLPAGSYLVRILRIGFRSFDAGRITVTGDAPVILNVAWDASAIPLATMLVKADRACKISPDSGTLIANVWEETRKALLSSMIAEQSEAPDIERVNFERYVDTAGVIVNLDASIDRSKSFRAYTSWSPDSLALHGYVIIDGNVFAMVGPDATTLFSDSFAGTHCFTLIDGVDTHADDIGLAFTPVKSNNKDKVDISGTFWVNRSTWGLRSVEYSYMGSLFDKDSQLAGGSRPGGLVEFGSLTSGQWLVTNWRIARPIIDPAYQFANKFGTQIRGLSGVALVVGIDESGGFVTNISHNDTTQLHRSLPALSLQLVSHDSLVSASGAQVRITGIDTVFTPDQNGRVVLPGFLDGKYFVSTTFPSVSSFARVAVDKLVTVSGADVLVSIEAPTMNTVVRTSCGPGADFKTKSALVGTLLVNQRVRPGVSLIVQWPTHGQSDESGLHVNAVVLREVVTNSDGRFVVCEVPRGVVVVQASGDVSKQERRFTLNTADPVQLVTIDLPPPPPTDAGPQPLTANVEVQLFDTNNQPLSRKVRFVNSSKKTFDVTTDKFGRALLPDQPEGLLSVTIDKQPVLKQTLAPGYNLVRIIVR